MVMVELVTDYLLYGKLKEVTTSQQHLPLETLVTPMTLKVCGLSCTIPMVSQLNVQSLS
jgi:hypothetical protein